jgi:hypothetical protein
MIDAGNGHIAQEIRIHHILWVRFAGIRAQSNRWQSHDPHQALNPLAAYSATFTSQLTNHLP